MSDSDMDIREEANELQSYLESFNKEIQIVEGEEMEDENGNEEKEVVSEGEEEGTYFVDQAGNYYYQATKDSEPLPATELLEENENDKTADETSDNPIEEFIEEEELVVNKTKNKKKRAKETKKKMKTRSKKKKDEISYLLIMEDNMKQDDDKSKDWKPSNDDESSEKDGKEQGEEEEGTTEVIRIINKSSGKDGNLHVCGYCDYSSTKRYLLARHLKSHSDERPFKCSICERGFKTQASLQNHVNTHTGIKPHQCTYCQSAFTTSGELVRHIRYRHTHEKPHKCTECDYASVELSKLKRHIRCHTGERPYQCPHCTYASPDTFKLKRHLRIHTGEKPYECDICHARFTQSNSLKAHKLIHSVGDKPVFQCELCPTTCGRKTDLRIHVQKLHTSDQPLKCRRCNQLFPDRYSYKVHLKTHDGEKCFKCELCPYASISARHLESHMLIHTDQKPFECSFCEQSFRQKQLLKRHNNLYHNKDYIPPRPKPKTHVCPDCGRSFSHKGNLIRHMAIHDPESGAREEAFALKMGRQKKIHVLEGDEPEIEIQNIDGVEQLISQDDDTKEKEEMDMIDSSSISIKDEQNDQIVALQTDENQQFVVLEVIQVENHTATEELDEIENTDENQIIEGDYIFTVPDTMRDSQDFKEEILEVGNKSHQEEMEVCFGFDVN